ncbi:MAG TPA: lysophospholipid acyltransferase family protein, partial [Casimicrobiaceae bacterium]
MVNPYRVVRVFVHVLAGVGTTMFVFPFVSDARKRKLVKRWSRRLLRILNVSAQVRGELASAGGNVLLVANHISWLDIFVLNAHRPVRFVAKAEIARWPVISHISRGVGTVFIERERRRDTHRVT